MWVRPAITVSRCFLARPGQRRLDAGEVGLDQRQRLAHLQDEAGVHDVLGGGAPVHDSAPASPHCLASWLTRPTIG